MTIDQGDAEAVLNGTNKPSARVPLYVQIQYEIRSSIASGALVAGDRIPSETELAQRFRTTRATVARALHELVFEGAITRRIGSGSFVALPGTAVTLNTGRVRSFEQQAAESGGAVSYRLVSFRPVRLSTDMAARLNAEPKGRAFLLERLRLLDGAPISLESRTIVEALGERIEKHDLLQHSVHAIAGLRLGFSIVRVETAVLAGLVTPRVSRLMGVRIGRPLLVREHILIGRDERPLAAGRSVYTERFRLTYVSHGARDTG